ncbi:MAG: hypothetical protein JWR59_765 [Brevundimonas sp.]|nr:hypothetical protein [Brevundimonas sp.]
MDDLYRTANVLVRRVPGQDLTRWIVTFDNYGLGPGFDRQGFGEAFLISQNVSAIHIMGCNDDWYQYPEMDEACAAVRAAVADAECVMTYGSSMGGYAALRFAKAIGAHAILALSPQYSIQREHIPQETRWQEDAERIAWQDFSHHAIDTDAKAFVILDPKGPDRWQGIKIAQDTQATLIELPHTSHPVSTYLSEVGLLTPIVMKCLNDDLDPIWLRKESRRLSRRSGIYLALLARSQPAWRPRTGLTLATRAVEQSPHDPGTLSALALLLTNTGHLDEAITLHERLLEMTGRLPDYLIPYGETLLAAKRSQETCAVAEEVVRSMPNSAHIRAWAGHLFWKSEAVIQARLSMEQAVRLSPNNRTYRMLWATYRNSRPDHAAVSGIKFTPWLRLVRWWAGLLLPAAGAEK